MVEAMGTPGSESDPLSPLVESYLMRLRQGERPSLSEYTDRYPDLASQIHELFPALVMMEQLRSVAGSPSGRIAGPDGSPVPIPQRLGDYRILREVGRGGMGVVYEAVQETLGRHVALKVLPLSDRISPIPFGRFQREARTAAGLHHTNIVPVYDVGEHAGIHYFTMQFIRGQSLDAVLHEVRRLRAGGVEDGEAVQRTGRELASAIAQKILAGRFEGEGDEGGDAVPGGETEDRASTPPALANGEVQGGGSPEGRSDANVDPLSCQINTKYYHGVARVGLQVAEALAYAHQQGVVHRDIKLSNLLLDDNGTAWVTDFGLVKVEDGGDLTHPGDVVGTLRYMAPERFRGRSEPRGDIYGLGATLYELLTLRPAFEDDDRARLIGRIAHEVPPPPRSLDPRIPRDLETIVQKAMAKEPDDRYPTAEALAEDLRRFLADRPILARSATAVETLWRWSRRNPTVAGLMTAVVTLLIAITIGASRTAVRDRERAEHETRLRETAERSETRLRAVNADLIRSHYFQSVVLAEAALKDGNLDRAEDLLDRGCPTELRGWEWHCLRRLCSGSPLSLRGEPRVPVPVAFSPDGHLLVTPNLTREGTLTIRETATGREIRSLDGPAGLVQAAAFLPDGKHLASASQILAEGGRTVACEVRVWDMTTGQPVHTRSLLLTRMEPFPNEPLETRVGFSPDEPLETQAVFSPDGLSLALGEGTDHRGTIWVFEVATGRERCVLRGHTNRLTSFTFSPDGRRMASVSLDQTMRIWEAATGRELLVLRLGDNLARSIAFSRDGTRLATAGFRGAVTLWEAATGRQLLTFLGHDAPVEGLAFHPDGTRLASTSRDGTVRVWHAPTGRELLSLKGLVSHITRVLFSPDGSRLAAVNWDMKHAGNETTRFQAEVLVWDGSPVERGKEEPVLVLRRQPNSVVCLAFSPDGQSLASGCDDRVVRVWDIATGRELRALGGGDHGVNRVAFGPDGTRLASGTHGGEIRLWDVATGRELLNSGGKGEVMHLKFSPDGTRFASSHRGPEGGVWVWEVATGRLLHALRGHTWGAFGSWFSADGTRLVTAGGEAAVKTWDLTTGREVRALPLRGSIDRSSVVAFNPDGTRITRLGQAFDRTARIWDLTNGEELVGLETRANAAWSVEFSPDGRRIATAHWATAKVWDAATGMSLLTLRGHTDRVRGVAFSPDGKRLGTASMDRSVRVWDLTVLDEGHTHQLALDP